MGPGPVLARAQGLNRVLAPTRVLALALAAAAGLVAAVGVAAAPARADDIPGASAAATRPAWPKETVRLLGSLPIQDGGRVKPLSTYASFKLLRTRGNRSYPTTLGERLGPTEWMLDCLFFPEMAIEQRVFRIENDECLDAVGLGHEGKKKRDYYTYVELRDGRERIFQKAQEFAHIDEGKRTPVQQQIVHLAMSLADFERFLTSLDFARQRYPLALDESPALGEVFGGRKEISHADALEKAPLLIAAAERAKAEGRQAEVPPMGRLIAELERKTRSSANLAIFAPAGTVAEEPEWMSPLECSERFFGIEAARMKPHLAAFRALERMAAAPRDTAALQAGAEELHLHLAGLAEARGEYDKIPLEIAFYRGDFFFYALILFVVGFVLSSGTWLMPWSRWLARLAPLPTFLAIGLVVAGITLRCLIRSRPPVSTLYETILFITGCAAIAAVAMRYITREPLGMGVGALFGALGMFLANRYEMQDAVRQGDTMPSLVAVLDTNFWLATHVTTVTIGYAAGLLASGVAHIHILGKLVGFRRNDPGFYRSIHKMIYGIVGFGLVFSVVGTILGGIWANDSWGRFWGWDPKENGALLICLWGLIMLHARLGGYIREHGMALAAIFLGAVVAASWWGVNLMEIGLHSYGFTSGAMFALLVFGGIEAAVMLAGGAWWLFSADAGRGAHPARPLDDKGLERLT